MMMMRLMLLVTVCCALENATTCETCFASSEKDCLARLLYVRETLPDKERLAFLRSMFPSDACASMSDKACLAKLEETFDELTDKVSTFRASCYQSFSTLTTEIPRRTYALIAALSTVCLVAVFLTRSRRRRSFGSSPQHKYEQVLDIDNEIEL